jgi:hypothetical protein
MSSSFRRDHARAKSNGGNPFAFRVGEKKMQKKHAPQYYPPKKRNEFKDYLSKTSIKFNQMVMPHDYAQESYSIYMLCHSM